MATLSVIVLAAGKGKRMLSDRPKVLHEIGGKPLLGHVLETAGSLGPRECVVVFGHGGEAVKAACAGAGGVTWVHQSEQLGTGHAVAQALAGIMPVDIGLVLYGDVPLIRHETLQPLIASASQDRLALLTAELSDPSGYGRIVRDTKGQVERVVEERDADPEQCRIREVNTGILAAPLDRLQLWVNALGNHNSQSEYYLTDVIEMAVREGLTVEAFCAADSEEVLGINDRRQQAQLERYYQRRQANALLDRGVTLLDPERIDIRGALTTGRDVVIDIGVIFEGEVRLGDGVRVGPYCVLRDVTLGDGVEVLSHCSIEGARIERDAQIGPFARLRPGAQLGEGAKVGNFVEVKQATIGPKSKVSHLSYIGDTAIGTEVNVGAGTITCNYDGANKHKTIIEDRVFIGSNSALVAPVRIGEGATVGAGSTLTRDVPAGSLGVTRAPQKHLKDWQRPVKQNKKPPSS